MGGWSLLEAVKNGLIRRLSPVVQGDGRDGQTDRETREAARQCVCVQVATTIYYHLGRRSESRQVQQGGI